MNHSLNDNELAYWLALLHAPTVGSITFKKLLKKFGSARQLFELGEMAWRDFGAKKALIEYLHAPDWAQVEKDLAWQAKEKNCILTLNDAHYPSLLAEIHDSPPILFVHGNAAILNTGQIAMVGTRNPSVHGQRDATEFAQYLAEAGFTITSGLALGVDTAAHEGALRAAGTTIAVAGTGLDRVYPARNRDLAHQIAEKGALISEFSIGTEAQAKNFPRRNRIISGISTGTLVVEAALKSGSLITARQAAEQGREVFAIPGSIHNPLARGCHALIREGAKLVETANDVVEELLIHLPSLHNTAIKPLKSSQQHNTATEKSTQKVTDSLADLDPDYQNLVQIMGATPLSIDELVEKSGLTAGVISSMLLILELRGLIASQPGGLYLRVG